MSDKYPPGQHPNSLQNLAKSPRTGRSKVYPEGKKVHEVTVSQPAWEECQAIAERLGFIKKNKGNVSELLERIGRHEIECSVKPPREL